MSGDGGPLIKAEDGALALMHSSVLSSIALFDQKCSMLLTIDSGALVFCVGTITSLVPGVPADLHVNHLGGCVLALAAAFFFLSALNALFVVWPRTGKSQGDALFWNNWPDVDKHQDYTLQIQKLAPDQVVSAISRHLGRLGEICRQKKALLRGALFFVLAGLLVLLLTTFVHVWGLQLLAMSPREALQMVLLELHISV